MLLKISHNKRMFPLVEYNSIGIK